MMTQSGHWLWTVCGYGSGDRQVLLQCRWSHGRMEEFVGTTPFYSGPIYFFDQFKPKTRKWKKDTQEDQLSYPEEEENIEDPFQNLEHLSHQIEQSREPKVTQKSTVALPEQEDQSHLLITSEPPSTSKFPLKSKFSKMNLRKTLFGEYKFITSEILCELETMLKRCAKNGMDFPGGVLNLMTYSWQELIEDCYKNTSPKTVVKRDRDMVEGPSSGIITNFQECQVNPEAKTYCREENQPIKAKKISQKVQNKLSEKPCKLKLLVVVMNIPCRKEEAKQKRDGFNKQLILRYYNDVEEEETTEKSQESPVFWMALLEGKAQMPAMGEANPEMKKFHYALISPSIYLLCLTAPPILSPALLLAVQLFIKPSGVLDRSHSHSDPSKHTEKARCEDMKVNKYITVTISGRFAITLVYKWHLQSLKLSLSPEKHKPPHLPDKFFPGIKPPAKEMLASYKRKCKLRKIMAQNKDASNSADPVDTDSDDLGTDISLLHDLVASIKLRKMQKKIKHILLHWLNYYRSTLRLESLHVCKLPMFAKRAARKPKVTFAIPGLTRNTSDADWYKEYLRYRNTFLTLKEFFKSPPHHHLHRTPTIHECRRLPLLTERKDLWFSSQLVCPMVLRKTMCGEKWDICRCSGHIIPEVTDLEYDNLIGNQLSHMDQIIVVCVFSAKQQGKTIGEVTNVYKEINKSRHMPCVQIMSYLFSEC
ncbi:hypothetical protein STEG23_031648 [Scotinomys teguina]